jgi:hypothetical protein
LKINELVKELIDNSLQDLHVALPAKIEKYDPQKMRAEVVPLAKKKLNDQEFEMPKILEVPVAHLNAGPFIIRPPYQKGDKVQILFNERALDNLLISGDPESTEYERKHSLDDAVVIKGLKTEQEADLPSEENDSLYLANIDTNSRVFIRKNGDIVANNEDNKVNMIKGGDMKAAVANNLIANVSGNVEVTSEKNVNITCTNAVINADAIKLGSDGASEPIPLGNALKNAFNKHKHAGNLGTPTSPPISPYTSSLFSSISFTD